MAEIWVAGAAVVVGAGINAYSANQSAKAQKGAANSAIGEQQREYDQSRQDQLPWLNAGQTALTAEQNYLNGDTSGFQNSPDYQFAQQQGTKQLDAGATANGNLWGGGADADRISLGQGLATQYANNYWSKLQAMAGQGQSSASNLGALGANTANQIGNQYNNIGAANASSYAGTANSLNNALNQGANLYGQYQQSSYIPSTGYGNYSPNISSPNTGMNVSDITTAPQGITSF